MKYFNNKLERHSSGCGYCNRNKTTACPYYNGEPSTQRTEFSLPVKQEDFHLEISDESKAKIMYWLKRGAIACACLIVLFGLCMLIKNLVQSRNYESKTYESQQPILQPESTADETITEEQSPGEDYFNEKQFSANGNFEGAGVIGENMNITISLTFDQNNAENYYVSGEYYYDKHKAAGARSIALTGEYNVEYGTLTLSGDQGDEFNGTIDETGAFSGKFKAGPNGIEYDVTFNLY